MAVGLNRGITEVTDDLQNTEVTSRKKYTAPWILVTENPGSIELTQVGANLDRQPVEKFYCNKLDNVYKNVKIDPSYRASSNEGVRTVLSSQEIWAVTPTATVTGVTPSEKHFPVQCTVSLTVPRSLPLEQQLVGTSSDTVADILQEFVNTTVGTAADRIISQLYQNLDARTDVFS